MPGRNVFTVLQETVRVQQDAKALHQPLGNKGGGGYRSYSWNDWLRFSREIALGLRALGLRKSEIVCVLSETRAEFYLADLGIMGAGGVSAALYTAYPMPELAKNVASAEPRFLFVEDQKSLKAAGRSIAGDWRKLTGTHHPDDGRKRRRNADSGRTASNGARL